MKATNSLFLSQSYNDTWDDYVRSLHRPNFPVWDYVVITASNEQQAEGFRAQLAARKDYLPQQTHFAVVPDEGGVRVGSGGATLSVLRYIRSREESFDNLRILVIHSGGDSKRVPQYSALGKLFSPVPRELPDGRRSTLFDEFIIGMSSMPSRVRSGMVLLSGDVLLLFNPLQVDWSGNGAAAISFKEHVDTGKNHGVFLAGEDGNVARFLHKQTEQTLRDCGAVNERDCVDIDTGAVIFSTQMLDALYGLIDTDEAYFNYVNSTVRLSLYGDFLYPLASDSTLEQFYLEAPEGEFCEELHNARTQVWNALRPFRMKLLRLAPAKFIHFGTTREILALMNSGIEAYESLGWNNQTVSSVRGDTACYNSVLSSQAKIGEGCYLETSYVHSAGTIGDNVVLSYIDIHDEVIPSDVVIHGLKQKDGKFVARIYGVNDDPKKNMLFGKPLEGLEDLWDSDNHTLWTAKLYPVCDTIPQAIAAALNVYELSHGRGDVAAWKNAARKSLCSGFNEADAAAIIDWDNRMAELVRMDEVAKLIRSGQPVSMAKQILDGKKDLTKIQREWLEKRLATAPFSEKMRLYYYIGKALGGVEGDEYVGKCFKAIQSAILENTLDNIQYNDKCRIVCDQHTVKSPLRVNWGGGWSDTPPYCNENGGTVLNVAILWDGENPVEVTLEKLSERKIVFDSRDMDVHGEFTDIAPLQMTGDPYDPFALQKAALVACGIIPVSGGNLMDILDRLGGGFMMKSEVTNVPKGSGLGTSSILSATCVKAIFEFMGIDYTENDLYSHVLCMEQIMATGGGWQDQVGGISPGIKYITSAPGLKQELKVQHIELPEKTKEELTERFALIYTGQRRLARNLLRDVVGRYVGNEPESLYALNEIQRMAALMRFELERGKVDEFAKLLDDHWKLSQQVDAGSTNTLIDQIFLSIDDLIDGRMICGAGGGGFLQVIMKKGVTTRQLHQRLKNVFQDNAVDVWPCKLVF